MQPSPAVIEVQEAGLVLFGGLTDDRDQAASGWGAVCAWEGVVSRERWALCRVISC